MIRSYVARGVVLSSLVLLPAASQAATFKEIVEGPITDLGDLVITLLYGAAFLVFLFGVVRYGFATSKGAEESRQKGRQLMLWGIIGLAVLFAVWGIVKVLLRLLTSWA